MKVLFYSGSSSDLDLDNVIPSGVADVKYRWKARIVCIYSQNSIMDSYSS